MRAHRLLSVGQESLTMNLCALSVKQLLEAVRMESQIALLKQLAEVGQRFTFTDFSFGYDNLYGGEDTPEWTAWLTRVTNLIEQYFSRTSSVFKVLQHALGIATRGNGPNYFNLKKELLLKAINMAVGVMQNDAYGELSTQPSSSKVPSLSTRIFVVHGHDHALKSELETLLHQFGLEPVVLHRQADEGRTIIEKFEEHADVGFAFVLMTPDDVAYSADQESVPDSSRKKERRSRPNVVFEHGYFVGRLGRGRVCCLFKGNVALPSDISGLLCKNVDAGLESQAFAIIKELKAAGYNLTI